MAENEIATVDQRTELAPLSSKVSVPQYHDDVSGMSGELKEIAESALDMQMAGETQRGVSERKQKYIMPTYWNSKAIDTFNRCSSAQQKVWVDTLKIAEKYYHKKASDIQKLYEPVNDLLVKLAPYAQAIQQTGLSIEDYIDGLIKFDKLLTANPVEGILRLMAAYKITYEMLENNAVVVADKINAEVQTAPLMAKINELQQSIESSKERVQPQTYSNDVDDMVDYIVDFYNQVDSSGRPLYPNAADMYEEIGEILQSGETDDLDKVYRLALKSRRPNIPPNDFKMNMNHDIEEDENFQPKGKESDLAYIKRINAALERRYQ
jgi:uncharacterized protein YoxC